MNRQSLSLLWTISIYSCLILIFLLISVDMTSKKDEFVTLGFQRMETMERERTVSMAGGTEDVFSQVGDVPIQIKKTKKDLSPLEKPPYMGSKLEKDASGKKGFTVAGEISTRKLLNFVKPEYPKGLNENTVVKLRISVNPDGSVATIEVVKTGGIQFDQSAIQAVREWRFQRLPSKVEQLAQSGIVTIYFQIR